MTIRIERLRTRVSPLRLDLHHILPTCILAGYGIFILSLFARHVMTWYINPSYVAPTTLAGAVLVGLGFTRLRGRSTLSCDDGCCSGSSCECDTVPPRLRTYAILAVPLLLALIFPPQGLASFSATERGPQIAGMTVLHGASTVRRVSLSVDTRSFTMMDWVGALSADPNPRDYMGKPVQITGLVVHNSGSVPRGYFMVLRYLVTCCIADARPVGLIVRDTSGGTIKDNQWVRVTGVMASAMDAGQKIVVVAPSRVELTRAGDPYMY